MARDDWDFPIGRGYAPPEGRVAVESAPTRPTSTDCRAIVRKAIDDLIAIVVDVAGEDADVVKLSGPALQVRRVMQPVRDLVDQLEHGGG